MKIKIFLALLLGSVLVNGVFFSKSVEALAITVKRVVFEGPSRAEVITVINNTDEQKTFRMGWKHFKMTEDKSLVRVSEDELPPGVKPASDMVRFAPRRFSLPPRGSQKVRMMLRTPSGLADGEYRSHLWIRPEQDVQAYRETLEASGKKSGAFMEMIAGTSMPVIVRKGNLTADVTIEGLSASRISGGIAAKYTINRQGNKSVYGDIDYICNKGGSDYLLKFTRGISVYSEVNRRNMALGIAAKPDQSRCNTLTVRYTETDDIAGKPVKVLAEATVTIQ